jgi:hypothetical protein
MQKIMQGIMKCQSAWNIDEEKAKTPTLQVSQAIFCRLLRGSTSYKCSRLSYSRHNDGTSAYVFYCKQVKIAISKQFYSFKIMWFFEPWPSRRYSRASVSGAILAFSFDGEGPFLAPDDPQLLRSFAALASNAVEETGRLRPARRVSRMITM